jgi:hypothetical protein
VGKRGKGEWQRRVEGQAGRGGIKGKGEWSRRVGVKKIL